MTTQTNLALIWASSGGTTPVSDIKYQTGWVAEIPTYQNFNFQVQTTDKNILHFAEESSFDWQGDINYEVGARVKWANINYRCIVANINEDPSSDTNNNYWVTGDIVGTGALTEEEGFKIKLKPRTVGTWIGQDQTIVNGFPLTGYFTAGTTKNWGFGNKAGEMVVVDFGVGTSTSPDGRDVDKDGANTFRLFHEGHLPTVSEVTDAIEEAPQDGKLYARRNKTWVEVTSTTVSATPPSPIRGAGQGWYNTVDGMQYTDVDDGDSVQWVPSSPSTLPANIPYDNTVSGLTAADLKQAIDELKALIDNI